MIDGSNPAHHGAAAGWTKRRDRRRSRLSARDITIKAATGGEFAAYLATPSAGEAPGIVVIQEIFGVN